MLAQWLRKLLAMQDRVDIRAAVDHAGARRPRAAHDQHPCHAACDVDRSGTVQMRVIPECARRMIRRNLEIEYARFVARVHGDQHVVLVTRRRDVQAVRVKVGVVETVRRRTIRISRPVCGRIVRLQLIVERHFEPRVRLDADGRSGRAAVVRAHSHCVERIRGRAVDATSAHLHFQLDCP